MTGGITNGGSNQGITTIKEGVTLMVGYGENKQPLPASSASDSATFIQKNVVLEENAKWYINVFLNESNFKITDKVTSQEGSKIYIDGNGDLSWNTEGLGEYHYNGNINIIGDTLEHDTMYIGDNVNTNTVTRTGKTDPANYTTTVNNIQGANATFVNKGTLNLNLSSADGYNLKTLTNDTDTEKGIFNITVQDNITLDLSNRTIQQKETIFSSDNSSSLTVKNAQLNSNLVNNLNGDGLTLQNSTVERQLVNQNQGQITLEQNSQISGQITNDKGTITILDDFIIQNGITGTSSLDQNIVNIGNASASKNATVTSSTTIQDQTINISSGSLTMNNAGEDGSISGSAVKVLTDGKLTANAGKLTNIIDGIQNSGIVEFTGGANDNAISGSGELIINGDVSNNTGRSVSQNKITVNEEKSFTANASDISAPSFGIVNAGNVTFIGGTNANVINGTGNLTIDGVVINEAGKTINQSSITINSNKSFTTNASDITTGDDGIGNEGTLQFEGGVNTSTITGNGNLLINGTVTNAEGTKITQSEVRVLADKKLTANASDINAPSFGIVNAGTVTFTGGTNANEITGSNGRLEITGEVTNNANVTQKEVFIDTTGDLTNNEGKTVTARELTNSGILTSNAGDIVISGTDKKITNNGTYNITGGTISGYNVEGVSIENSKVNILGDVTIASGKTITNNTVTLGNGTDEATLKLGKDDNLTNSTLIIKNGAILITDNGTASNVAGTVKIDADAQWEYQLDVDLEHIETIGGNDFGKADNLNVAEDGVGEGSKATITSIHLNKDKSTKTTVQIANRDIKAEIAENIVIYTTNYRYIVISRVDAEGHTVLDIEAAGYGGLQGAVYEGAPSYSVTGETDYLTAWIVEGTKTYDTLKEDLHIKGFENVLTSSTSASGIKTSSHTLTVTDLKEYSGFENAITVQKIDDIAGSLKVSSVTFTNNTGLAVIINEEGTVELSSVTFRGNGTATDIQNLGTLNIKANEEAKTTKLEKGILGTGTTNIESGAELINGEESRIIQSNMNVAGTLTNNNGTDNAISVIDKVTVTGTGVLTSSANAIKADNGIENAGTYNITGGTNNNTITNSGAIQATELKNSGTITNTGTITSVNKITNSGTITSDADKVIISGETKEIENTGTYNVTGGTNNNAISGTGTLNVNGTVGNTAIVEQGAVEVKEGATLTNAETGKITSTNAIRNSGIITSRAEGIETGVGVRNLDNGTYNIEGGRLGYDVLGVSTETSKVNIKDDVTIGAGNFISRNDVTLEEGKKLKMEREGALVTSELTVNNGSTLDVNNGEIGIVRAGIKITENADWNLNLTVKLGDIVEADLLSNVMVVGNNSKVKIGDIGFLGQLTKTKNSVQISNENIKAYTDEDKVYTNQETGIRYKVYAENRTDSTWLLLEAYGYGGLANAIFDKDTSYTLKETETGSNTDYVTEWITLGGTAYNYLQEDLRIHGDNKILKSSTNVDGIVSKDRKLVMNNLTMTGFNNAITINTENEAEPGLLEVSSVTFVDNKGTAVISNSVNSEVTLRDVKFKENDVTYDILNNGNLVLRGQTSAFTNGIYGTGTTTIDGVNINMSQTDKQLFVQDMIRILTSDNSRLDVKVANLSTEVDSETKTTRLILNNNQLYLVGGETEETLSTRVEGVGYTTLSNNINVSSLIEQNGLMMLSQILNI